MVLFNEAVNATKWWQYIDDWKGNLSYVKDWQILNTLTWLWKSISSSSDSNFDYQIKENTDWSYSAFTIDKKTNKITQQVFDMNWNLAGWYLATLWNWEITSYGWVHDWWKGLDIDWNIWDNVFVPLWWKVIEVKNYWDKTFGKSVVVELEDWKQIRYSHLNEFSVKVWDTLTKWSLIWTLGNTWYVVPWKWWDWSHLDIQVSWMNAYQVEEYLKTVWLGDKWESTPMWWFKQESIPMFANYLQTWKLWSNTEELKAITQEFWSIENFKKQAEAYNNAPWWPRETELNKIIGLKNELESFISKENKWALDNSIGTIQQTWSPWTAREKENYLANIQSFLSAQTLQALIDAKGDWATFGALSNEELRMLQSSASKLNSLILTEDKKDPTRITWFKWTKENFEKIVNELAEKYQKTIEQKQKLMWTDKDLWDSL
jgi:hypothetical protein